MNTDEIIRNAKRESLSRGDVSSSVREIGSSNNVILGQIMSQNKEVVSQLARLATAQEAMVRLLSEAVDHMSGMRNSMEDMKLAGAMSSMSLNTGGEQRNVQYLHNGTKLTSRYHWVACVLQTFITMIEHDLSSRMVTYPDSVNCHFKDLAATVMAVCKNECNVPGITNTSVIEVGDKKRFASSDAAGLIASRDSSSSGVLTASNLHHFTTPVVAETMKEAEWVRQRLCLMDGVLSPLQVDILKSMSSPLVATDGDGYRVNYKPESVLPRNSGALHLKVRKLLATPRGVYIAERMKGRSMQEAYNAASKDNQSE